MDRFRLTDRQTLSDILWVTTDFGWRTDSAKPAKLRIKDSQFIDLGLKVSGMKRLKDTLRHTMQTGKLSLLMETILSDTRDDNCHRKSQSTVNCQTRCPSG